MKIAETPLPGAFVLDVERIEDERGFFARTFCADTLTAAGLEATVLQSSVSFNKKAGTVRGMHFQAAPHEEVKLVSCLRGRIHDVIVDLRPGSPTFRRSFGIDLAAEELRTLYIPRGFAHGFQTLVDESLVGYQMTVRYVPGAGRGVRWDDPSLDVSWPLPIAVIAERDATYPDFEP